MVNNDDQYLWQSGKEESFPKINIVQLLLGVTKFLFFLNFTLFFIPIFLISKFFYKYTGVKSPMLIVRKFWSLVSLRICGLRLRLKGQLSTQANILVSNHVSWIDILVIQSVTDVIFIAKHEVIKWPGLGFLARLADTLFVERNPHKIVKYSHEIRKIMSKGYVVCFFPEGTSSDGLRVLKFRSSFFQLAYSNESVDSNSSIHIQPLSLFYSPKDANENIDFYGWWGSMSLFSHIVKVLCLSSGSVTLKFHHLLSSKDYQNRKDFANDAKRIIEYEIVDNLSN